MSVQRKVRTLSVLVAAGVCLIASGCGAARPEAGGPPPVTATATASASSGSENGPAPSPSLPPGIARSVPVGLGPNGVTFAFGSIWVANHHDASVTRVDPQTGATTATIAVAGTPGYVSSGFGSIWVTDYSENGIYRIDPMSNAAVHVKLGHDHGAGFTGCGAVPAFGSIWVADGFDVVRVDPRSNKVIASARVQKGPDDSYYSCVQQAADGLLWSRGSGPKLYGIDPRTNHVAKTLPVADVYQAHGMRWTVRMLPSLEDSVTWSDPRTQKTLMRLKVPDAIPTDLIVVFSPGRAWIIDDGDDSLREVDLRAKKVLRTIDIGGLVGPAAFADGSLWLPVFDKNALWAVKPS